MKKPKLNALPKKIRERAEQFFGLPFGDVRLFVSDLPRLVGAKAFAFGRTVHFLPDVADFTKQSHLALLGHELTHVVQQSQGQVPGKAKMQGLAFDDDPVLEAQAWRLGWRFATGQSCDVSFTQKVKLCDPVLQRAVVVDGLMPNDVQDLNGEPSAVVQLIEGGEAWFNWACKDMNVRYEFENQLDLTKAVQIGLHGINTLLLNKLALWVSPLKLLTLEPSDFWAIVSYELGIEQGRSAQSRAIKALQANDLRQQNELDRVDGLLDEWKVIGQPVFQALGLNDRIALIQLFEWLEAQGSEPDFAQRDAASFAINIAQSPQEFVDYFQYYFTLTQRNDWEDDDDVNGHHQQATNLITQMLPQLRTMLRAAVLEARPTTQALQEFICAWQDMGLPLGFQRISAAINQVTQQTTLGTPNQPVTSVIEAYLQAAQVFIRNQEANAISLSQDGLISSYTIVADDAYAKLLWSSAGDLTLKTFGTHPIPSETDQKTTRLTRTKGASSGNQKGKSQSQKSRKKASTKPPAKEGDNAT